MTGRARRCGVPAASTSRTPGMDGRGLITGISKTKESFAIFAVFAVQKQHHPFARIRVHWRFQKQHHPLARIRVHWRFQKKHHPFARIRVHWRFRLTAGLTRTSGAQPITNLKSQIPLALLASWRFNLKITNLKSPDFPPRFPFLKNAHPAIIIATNTPASRLFRRAGQIQRKGYP